MFSFWKGSGNWQGYKFTTVGALAGIVKNLLLDNYWIFTNIPMSGDDASEPATKFIFSVGQILAGVALGGGIGLLIDYERSKWMERNSTEETPLTSINVHTPAKTRG